MASASGWQCFDFTRVDADIVRGFEMVVPEVMVAADTEVMTNAKAADTKVRQAADTISEQLSDAIEYLTFYCGDAKYPTWHFHAEAEDHELFSALHRAQPCHWHDTPESSDNSDETESDEHDMARRIDRSCEF